MKAAFTLSCYRGRLAEARKLGMKVVYQSTYSLPQPNFSAIALAIRNAHPDVVAACTFYPDSVGLTQALHDQGFAPRFLAETAGPVEAVFVKTLGPLANGVISSTSWWPSFKTQGNSEFIAAYKAKYRAMPDYHAADGYGAVQALGAAVTATKSVNQAKIRKWLLHHQVPTVTGVFKVDRYGRATGFTMDLVQIQNGVLKLVTPPDLAEAKILPYRGE